MHLACIIVLGFAALGWVAPGWGNWQRIAERILTLGKFCFLTLLCFLGIHLINSIPAQVQANPPSLTGVGK